MDTKNVLRPPEGPIARPSITNSLQIGPFQKAGGLHKGDHPGEDYFRWGTNIHSFILGGGVVITKNVLRPPDGPIALPSITNSLQIGPLQKAGGLHKGDHLPQGYLSNRAYVKKRRAQPCPAQSG